jgi:hypothetical protein
MRARELTVPEIMLIGGTRGLLGAGLALLLADRLNVEQRRAVGWTLFLVGAVTTIPIALNLLSKPAGGSLPSHKDES